MKKVLLTNREKDVIRTVMELLAGGLALTAMFLAPGAAGVIGKSYLGLQKAPSNIKRQAFAEMRRQGLVRVSRDSWLALTKKGRKRLQKYTLENLAVTRPRVWDGKWRIVMFDIPRNPRTLNRARDHLRRMLKQLGLVSLQMSVWVHPFPCEEEISYVVELYGLQPYVRLAVAESVTGEQKLRKEFKLQF